MNTIHAIERFFRMFHLPLVASVAVLCSWTCSLHGQVDIEWNNAAGGSWTAPINWDPINIPNNFLENAIVDLPGTYTIDLNSNIVARSLWLTNPDATIDIATSNASSRTLTLQGDSQNDGTINLISNFIGRDVSLTRLGKFTNNGTFNLVGTNIAADRDLNVDTFDNSESATLNILADTRLHHVDSVFNNWGAINIGSGALLTMHIGDTTFNHNDGSLDNQGTVELNDSTFNFNGGMLMGNPIEFLGGTLNIGAGNTNAGTFRLRGPGISYNGDLAPDQTLNIEATPISDSSVIANSDFVNDGTINLSNDFNGQEVWFRSLGAVTNNGIVNLQGTNPTSERELNVSMFDNAENGTVNILADSMINQSGGDFYNSGTLNISTDATLIFGDNPSASFIQEAGTLNLQGAMEVQGIFEFNGGTITGSPILMRSGILRIGAGNTSPATFFVHSIANQLNGNLAADQTLHVAATATGNSHLFATANLTNDGTIILTSNHDGNSVSLFRNGTITNNGNIQLQGIGDAERMIEASLTNNGSVDVLEDSTIGEPGRVHVNHGVIRLQNSSARLLVIGDSFVNETDGRIEGGGEIQFGLGFPMSNRGVIAPGWGLGKLTIDDTILQTESTLEIELGGTLQSDEYDVLEAANFLGIGGTLNVTLVDGFETTITSTDEFTIVSANILVGQFNGVPDGGTIETTDGQWRFDVSYSQGNVVLSNATMIDILRGDVNQDGNVDLLDVAPFVDLVAAGTYQAEADINDDGAVDLLDVAPFVNLLAGG